MRGITQAEAIDRAVPLILQHFRIGSAAQSKHEDVYCDDSNDDCSSAWHSNVSERLEPLGVRGRRITLESGWQKDFTGPMIAAKADSGSLVLLLPRFSGYMVCDLASGRRTKVSEATAASLCPDAMVLYRPLPTKSIHIKDLVHFLAQTPDAYDLVWIVACAILATLLGMITPWLTELLFSYIIPMERVDNVFAIACVFVSAALALTLISVTKSLVTSRISIKLQIAVETATMSRLLSLPATFFREYDSGELQSRLSRMPQLCTSLVRIFFSSGLSALFSIAYLAQLALIAPSLFVPALVVLLLEVSVLIAGTFFRIRVFHATMTTAARLNGLVMQLFLGVRKLKVAGAEARAYTKWASKYKEYADNVYNPVTIVKIQPVLSSVVTLLGMVILYSVAALTDVTTAQFMGFNSAFGLVSGAIISLASMVDEIAGIKPMLEMVDPILKAVPESNPTRQRAHKISGSVSVRDVTFAYPGQARSVLSNISLEVEAGEYLGIVGRSGCGKSTLVRLLLGFETPQNGTIEYDGKDIGCLDLASLRRQIGVCLQSGKLFPASIFENIAITAPWLSMDQAWEAARMAGIADDIDNMPMGMHTVVSEGSTNISGGQRQRIMIARAIAPSPALLLFDEATSALDNVTQKAVSAALASLNCTRIVIAHRLSTVQDCDRIIVIDDAKIAEQGTYGELLALEGIFADLVRRQIR